MNTAMQDRKHPTIVLGIESSCDETAAAVVDGRRTIRSNVVRSQVAEHESWGGVVPEIAARSHVDHLDGMIELALEEAGAGFGDMDAIAATGGPGLIGGVLVGSTMAKAIALARGIPYIAVNHLEGHALTARLTHGIGFPFLLLLVSGGHCQLVGVEGVGRYHALGGTIDDAVGEAFDKTAKLLGLGYPGGPALERLARAGDPGRVPLPSPMVGRPGCDFSYSGLKTAVRHRIREMSPLSDADRADIAAAFQAAAVRTLIDRSRNAITWFRDRHGEGLPFVAAGGVAANRALRGALDALAGNSGMTFVAPPAELCTDNAAMIAWAGVERLNLGLVSALDFAPRPRWPLAGRDDS